MNNKTSKTVYLILTAVLICTAVSGLFFGGAELTAAEVIDGLFAPEGTNAAIVRLVRLPRVLGAMLAGAGLALSGAILQAVCDNPLAGPNIIGVNSGAGFAAVCVLAFLPQAAPALPFFAFIGALGASLIIVYTARAAGGQRSSVILAGIALTALLNAAISFINLLFDDVLIVYNSFSVGGLAGVFSEDLVFPAIMTAISLSLSLVLSRRISLLALGDECAASFGINVRLLRITALICASASAAAAVSFAGLIGFVGLAVPHIARKITKRSLCFGASAMLGAAILTLSDTLGRAIFAPSEIPVGIITALLGAPFFLYLLLKSSR
ncbi:MAG: iron ABC transporter permease [Clostridia bacterium]|nr:iron ABC transporter permease [Clostridia bacterium]